MGDVINLVKKAQEHIDEKESEELEKKMRKATFTYEDYLKQMGMVKKMGSFKSLLKMMPGMGAMGDIDFSDKEFGKLEAIILSMTPRERQEKDELEHTRRKRVAKGSGVDVDDVNRMVKGFKRVKQLFKNMPDLKGKMKGLDKSKHSLKVRINGTNHSHETARAQTAVRDSALSLLTSATQETASTWRCSVGTILLHRTTRTTPSTGKGSSFGSTTALKLATESALS